MGSSPIHCLAPPNQAADTPACIEIHRSHWSFDHQRYTRLQSGLAVTNPCRTLFALAAHTLTQRRFGHIADVAWNLGLVTPFEMADYLERHRCRGKDGVAFLENWIEQSLLRDRATQSYFERDLLDALDGADLPMPVTQRR
jgi:hypothetical protein